MMEEIFGPVLPVLTVKGVQAGIDFVNARPKPLTLYVFSSDRETQRVVLEQTLSGGACVNDTVQHLAVLDLPFGGVGASGIGTYQGKWTFETFSHPRGVLDRMVSPDSAVRYPPYHGAMKWIRRLIG